MELFHVSEFSSFYSDRLEIEKFGAVDFFPTYQRPILFDRTHDVTLLAHLGIFKSSPGSSGCGGSFHLLILRERIEFDIRTGQYFD